jgi:D-alanyl-D-alanine carboxypeptidase
MKKKIKIFLFISFLAAYALFLIFSQKYIENYFFSFIAKPFFEIPQLKIPKEETEKPEIEAKAAISYKIGKREKILFKKNEEEPLPIASLTKLMTAVIVLEDNNYDFEKSLEISPEAANQGNTPNCGNLDSQVGKKIKIKELFELMLSCSSNDAAFALSEVIGNDRFVGKMNQKAKEIGLNKTHFINPTGLDPADSNDINYSTANDLIMLAKYILKNHPLIFEMTLKKTSGNNFSNLNLKNNQKLIGGKTGYTKRAGGSIIIIFQNENGTIFMNVILGTEKEEDRIREMQKLIDWINTENNSIQSSFNPDFLVFEKITSQAPWQERDSQAALVFKNKIWLMGGLNGNGYVVKPGLVKYEQAPHFSDIWVSENGKNWELLTENAPWGKRRSMQVVEFKGKIWLIGGWGPEIGLKNDVWYSEDGVNWVLATSTAQWSPREGHTVVVFNDKLWLMGGVDYFKRKTFNDVWYSEDGINWVLATSSALWKPRWDQAVTVFKEKIWLTGGMDLNGKIFRDVWFSEDGREWKLATDNPPWGEKQGHALLSYQDKIWLLGGLNDSEGNSKNGVWYSEDGINWKKTKDDPNWTGREDFSAIIFNNKIWILGGMDINWSWRNDVWCSNFLP